ncbi:hypothetical protein M011DRAFT_401519 [Sporormia fimetaria CBS 119925]|uniref:Guanine nucleotide-exchange factor SEC12 n=1 Tax=Sporormia fimetaria CBS 119925 TaxID=1340428 RepID=A0A6A6VGA0_9PLEO|nr:hypothetical protein M011DRAFT_401519 [Sporormia fimetaria CBS 119925]
MGPPSVSKANVKYPIFAATFATNNPAILLVGGGGGAGRSGVPNSICAFDTSSRAPNLEPFARLDLSRDEDSVTSAAAVSTKEGCILYAGVNSGEIERIKGQNSHLRAFQVTYPRKEDKGGIEFLSKTQLLNASSETARKEGYQRLIRLSPPSKESGGKRIGVIASSLQGNENELVTFSAVSTKPTSSDVIQRVPLRGQEINDVDVFLAEDGHYQVAYCLDGSVSIQRFTYDFESKKTGAKLDAPRKRYEVPSPDLSGRKPRPKIRALRWLTANHLLLLVNFPNRSGVELQVLKLYSEEGMGSILLRKKLGSGAKQAVDMDVARLDADPAGAYQCAIAVATQDVSLHVHTIDFNGVSLRGFAQYAVYHNVHDVQMTKAVWSPFTPAKAPTVSSPQFLRLASTSLSGSVSVETFELQTVSSGARRRFVLLSSTKRKLYNAALYAAFAFIIAMLAVMLQSLVDPHGDWTKGIVPASLQKAASGYKAPGVLMEEARGARAVLNGATAPVAKTSQRIGDLLHLGRSDEGDASQKAVIIRHEDETGSSLSTEVHDAADIVKTNSEARKWEELSHEERKRWKDKLVRAGLWAQHEGETILKGIFFSEARALVGHVAEGMMNR